MELTVYRGATTQIIDIDENTKLQQDLLGKDIVTLRQTYMDVKDIAIGDYITVDTRNYYVNQQPNITKTGREYKHEVTFEALWYDLTKVQYIYSDLGEFDLVGNLTTFLNLIVTNMNRVGAGWSTGTVTATDKDNYKHLHFSCENCMQVLQRLADEYDAEFYFTVKAISMVDSVGAASGLTFEYGRGKGLRSVSRKTATSENIVTRLYAFGAKRNLGPDYRSGKQRLEFSSGGNNYLEKNTTTYGTIEHTVIYDDIFPKRTGSLTSISTANIYVFKDSAMDFDVNSYLLSGMSPKLHFQTGDLGGYTFELTSYNNTDKRFEIIGFEDDHGIIRPNTTIHAATGDKYVLLDLLLPTSYITSAESLLQAEAQSYLDDNCEPAVEYEITPDWRYFKDNDVSLEVGDTITVTDNDLSINTTTRIVSLTKCLSSPYKYVLKVASKIRYNMIQRLYATADSLSRKVSISDTGNLEEAARSWMWNRGELTARRIQTDTGFPGHYQRIVLDRDDNTLRMYTAANTNVIIMDDSLSVNVVVDSKPGIKVVDGIVYIEDGSADDWHYLGVSNRTQYSNDATNATLINHTYNGANESCALYGKYTSDDTSSAGTNRIGVKGEAQTLDAGNNNTAIGVYGHAAVNPMGAGAMYAGYFNGGDVYIKNELELDGDLNHDGSKIGFFATAPASQDAGWSVSNLTTDRVFDANSTDIAELADVVGTLINALKSYGILGG